MNLPEANAILRSMKYIVLIIDGAAGHPLPGYGGKTCLELAHTPNMNSLAEESLMGMTRTVPRGMEPSSACACMSILGYNPETYYRGRSAIEAKSIGIPLNEGEVFFRCNLVYIENGKMASYSAGSIEDKDARELIASLQQNLGNENIHFYPGISYRHICKIAGHEETLMAICTPPHDIPGKPIADFLPHGQGSALLRELMLKSEEVLSNHKVNIERRAKNAIPATMVWLFWGSGQIPDMPSFKNITGLRAAITSGVDLLKGLAKMTEIDILNIPGVSDDLTNDYEAQASGAMNALEKYDLVIIHVESPDEAGHTGSISNKVDAIEKIDKHIVKKLKKWSGSSLRVLIMPDHPTPIVLQTHTAEPIPFMVWGLGNQANGAKRFTEAEALKTGLFIDNAHTLISQLLIISDKQPLT